MIVGWIRSTYQMKTIQYVMALSITTGLILFEADKVDFYNLTPIYSSKKSSSTTSSEMY
jgi:hypothetical protein